MPFKNISAGFFTASLFFGALAAYAIIRATTATVPDPRWDVDPLSTAVFIIMGLFWGGAGLVLRRQKN